MNFDTEKPEAKRPSGRPQNKTPSPEIKFKPITEGLGFHQFSDGLPYAPQNGIAPKREFAKPSIPSGLSGTPVGSSSPQMGTGAVAAGRPMFKAPSNTFTPPRPPGTRLPHTPTTPYSAPANYSPSLNYSPTTYTPAAPSTFTAAPQAKAPTTAQAPSLNASFDIPEFGMGYVFQRVFGYVIDCTFNLSVSATILSFALIQTDLDLLQGVSQPSMILSGIFLYLCNWAAIAGQEVAFGTSLGKRVFGLSLNGNGSDAFIRAVAFIPSQLLGGLGILSALFDSSKRCWHDRFARVQPTLHA